LNKLEQGEVFFPLANATWVVELEQEFLSWTGLPDEPADQIDAAAYAARHARQVDSGESWQPIRTSRSRSVGIPGLWTPG
jgi:hypothetical protein